MRPAKVSIVRDHDKDYRRPQAPAHKAADVLGLSDAGSVGSQESIIYGKEGSWYRESLCSDRGESEIATESPPPDGGYGWICCASSTMMNAHTWGIHSSYAVFLAHFLENDTFKGTSPLAYAFVGSLGIACSLAISPIATICARQFGSRRTMFCGALLEGAGLAFASFASQIWHLVLTQGILFGFGMGLLNIPAASVVPSWFSSRRSLANGISASGSGLGGFLYALATGAIIRSLGLKWAFYILGILAFTVNAVCAVLLRDRNKDIGASQLAFKTALLTRPEFLLVLSFSCFSMIGYSIMIFSLANYGTKIGLKESDTSFISGLFSLGQVVGRPAMGFLSDRVGRINVAASTSFLTAAFILGIWVNAHTYAVLAAFATLCGCVAGTFSATIGPVTAEVVGLKDMSSALNLIWLAILLPTLFSEPSALQIVTATGNYRGTQLFTGCMFMGAAFSLLAVRGWKISKVRNGARLASENVSSPRQEVEGHPHSTTPKTEAWSAISSCLKLGKV